MIKVTNGSNQKVGITSVGGAQKITIVAPQNGKIHFIEQASVPQILVERIDYDQLIKINDWGLSKYPVYKGIYNVTPTVEGRTLNTAKMLLEKDVTIREIPYYEVGNNSGGNTVYIASSTSLGSDPILGTGILGEMRL